MSEILLPPGIVLPKALQPTAKPDDGASDEEKAQLLPVPTGYKMLCIVPEVSKKIDGTELDLEKPWELQHREEQTTSVLFVLRVGPDAYKDAAKFPNGPWCKAGDFVMVRTYTGTRFKMYGKEMRLINDDQIEAVVQDPRGISHV
jgi:co-chaperonin GroES (HSP10)